MRIDHSGGDVFMSEKFLHRPYIGPGLQKMRRETVSQSIITLLINSVLLESPTGFTRFSTETCR